MGNPAFILLRVPVELEWADGLEGCEDCPEDGKVEVVAEVDPYEDEGDEIRADDGGVEVV